ncbi:granzyme B isoform X2 [Oryzias melastigma]|uniref:trypsin n=2 Tax=Oryzias melastigma TaxID=30732 RepID=A0A3B3DLJ4_ORYME|nr:granzyme B isoform X2 [Oryzias melastigma]
MQDCRILYLLLLLSVAENLPLVGASESGIVGGRVAKPHSRPYMASLQIHGHHICGGILIRDDYVLTAAHCKKDSQPLTVVLGAHDLSKKEKSQQRLTVKNYRKHDNFTGGQENDVMLLKLKTKAQLNKYVETINLPKKNKETLANIRCEVAGWGHTGVDKRISNVLKEASEETQFKGECKYIWREYFNPTQMICTKFTKKSGGICQGDSGGPLICNNKLLGLTAFTQEENCHNPKFPHVFMKISSFLPWIQTVMKE